MKKLCSEKKEIELVCVCEFDSFLHQLIELSVSSELVTTAEEKHSCLHLAIFLSGWRKLLTLIHTCHRALKQDNYLLPHFM